MKPVTFITVNTDASYYVEHGVGGYAFYIVCDLFKITKGGYFKKDPGNSFQAEVQCIGNALHTLLAQKNLPQCSHIVINTDCAAAIRRFDGRSKLRCEATDYVAGALVRLNARTGASYSFRHVKAHQRNIKDARSWVNDWCDKTAKKWAKIAIKRKHEHS